MKAIISKYMYLSLKQNICYGDSQEISSCLDTPSPTKIATFPKHPENFCLALNETR